MESPQQKRVVQLFHYWTTTAFLDTSFEETDATSFDDLLVALTWFCRWRSEEHSQAAEQLAELSHLLQRIEMKRMFIPTPTSLVAGVSLDGDPFMATDFHIAYCITLAQHSILSAIPPHEFLGQKWSGPKKSQAPNLVNYIDQWNSLCRWVSLTILRKPKLKERQAALIKWIKVAYLCFQWRNFSSLNAIVSSLSGQSIFRLKRTFAGVPAHLIAVLDAAKQLISSNQNYSNYRKIVAACSFPCIPYLGVTLKDLTFIEDGNPDVFEDGNINFAKNVRIYSALLQIFSAQKFSYQFNVTPRIAMSRGHRAKAVSKLDSKYIPRDLSHSVSSSSSVDTDFFPTIDISEFQGDIYELLPSLPQFELLPPEARVFLTLPKVTDEELFALSLEREKRAN